MSDHDLSFWGFIISIVGVIFSIWGTRLSWLSAKNAQNAANAANAAKNEVLKNQYNINLSQLRQTGLDARRQCLQLSTFSVENTWPSEIDKILISIQDFANQCKDITGQITVNPAVFQFQPKQINQDVFNYRKALKKQNVPHDSEHYAREINDSLSKLISTINEQIDMNIK
jgi:hypothetical protein